VSAPSAALLRSFFSSSLAPRTNDAANRNASPASGSVLGVMCVSACAHSTLLFRFDERRVRLQALVDERVRLETLQIIHLRFRQPARARDHQHVSSTRTHARVRASLPINALEKHGELELCRRVIGIDLVRPINDAFNTHHS
jgi:hypothetical protein